MTTQLCCFSVGRLFSARKWNSMFSVYTHTHTHSKRLYLFKVLAGTNTSCWTYMMIGDCRDKYNSKKIGQHSPLTQQHHFKRAVAFFCRIRNNDGAKWITVNQESNGIWTGYYFNSKIWHVVLASNASTQIILWLNYLWKKH